MPRKISPHAATLLALIDNAAALSVIRSEYSLARDVIRATEKICASFGFEIEKDVFEYIVNSIGVKPPIAMKREFDRFASMILNMDKKFDKALKDNKDKR
jgi:hypothetical protein